MSQGVFNLGLRVYDSYHFQIYRLLTHPVMDTTITVLIAGRSRIDIVTIISIFYFGVNINLLVLLCSLLSVFLRAFWCSQEFVKRPKDAQAALLEAVRI